MASSAGVAPALKRDGYIVATFRHWHGPGFVKRFRKVVSDAVREQAGPLTFVDGGPLEEMMRHIRMQTKRPVALLLDQFEDHVRWHSGTHKAFWVSHPPWRARSRGSEGNGGAVAQQRGIDVETAGVDALVGAPLMRCEGGTVHPFFLPGLS